MFKKYLGVLKCSGCSSDYIPLNKFDPERFFPIPQERQKNIFQSLNRFEGYLNIDLES